MAIWKDINESTTVTKFVENNESVRGKNQCYPDPWKQKSQPSNRKPPVSKLRRNEGNDCAFFSCIWDAYFMHTPEPAQCNVTELWRYSILYLFLPLATKELNFFVFDTQHTWYSFSADFITERNSLDSCCSFCAKENVTVTTTCMTNIVWI